MSSYAPIPVGLIAIGIATFFYTELSKVSTPTPPEPKIEQTPPQQVVRKDNPQDAPFWVTRCVNGVQYIMMSDKNGHFTGEKALRLNPETLSPIPCKE